MRHIAALRDVLTAPYAAREDIVAMQTRGLTRLIRHAYDQVPYYRNLFDRAGLEPEDVRSLADLPRVPISTKQDLVSAPPGDLFSRGTDPARMVVRRTSGSSGPIFTMLRSPGEEFVSEMHQLRIRSYYGLRALDTQVVAVMDTRTMKGMSRLHRWAHRLGFHRTFMVSPLLPPELFLDRLAELKPDVILGLTGPMARIAGFMDDRRRESIRPRYVITSGEVLTAAMRRTISAGFAAPVYDKYVCAELGHMAWECTTSGELHTADDQVILEVVRNGVPVAEGERGELVATSLRFHAMPFIRYRLADVVTRGREQCVCREPFSTIRAIQGRMIDYFYLPDGRVLHPYELGAAMQQSVDWVKEFQLIQERRDLIVANVVPTVRPSEEETLRVIGASAQLFGPGVELRLTFVDRIEWGETGKLRPFRSRVKSEYDDLDWNAISG
jgi:phenylacetate-CoA ligase